MHGRKTIIESLLLPYISQNVLTRPHYVQLIRHIHDGWYYEQYTVRYALVELIPSRLLIMIINEGEKHNIPRLFLIELLEGNSSVIPRVYIGLLTLQHLQYIIEGGLLGC